MLIQSNQQPFRELCNISFQLYEYYQQSLLDHLVCSTIISYGLWVGNYRGQTAGKLAEESFADLQKNVVEMLEVVPFVPRDVVGMIEGMVHFLEQ
mmetsp:Transcript_25426/g.32366  ORF Transcript_25426/g.32366 Transcript_25426/m.32366 type:complete len:95 (+) Transcript_25426:1220-1504(+)